MRHPRTCDAVSPLVQYDPFAPDFYTADPFAVYR
jgi:hypothetical protein